ncbi:MAG: AAA family ATPase [Holophagales bacterium]|nr:AAA family ATPase [Holophagales bacterium]
MTTERASMLPASEEAERAVLAAVLLRPELIDDLPLFPSDFYVERHRRLFAVYRQLAADRRPIDLRTVQAALEERGELEPVGGLAYLSGLDLDLPDLGRIETYAEIVRDRARRRELVDLGQALARSSFGTHEPLGSLLRRARRQLEELEGEGGGAEARAADTLVERTLARVAERRRLSEAGERIFGLPTGLPSLDRTLAGLDQGLYILAGPPGMGKTSLALQIALHAAGSHPVLYVSFENSGESLVLKAIGARAGVSAFDAGRGQVAPDRLERAAAELHPRLGRLSILDGSSRLGLGQVRSAARAQLARCGAESCLVVVDYVQLMAKTCAEYRGLSDVRAKVDTLAGDLISLSKRLGSPVLALSSQSRSAGGYGSGGGRDALDSLKESGDLEFGGDVVMFLTEDPERSATPPSKALTLSVRKNRHGPTAKIPLVFLADRGFFREEAPIAADRR